MHRDSYSHLKTVRFFFGPPCSCDFDAELVETVIAKMKRGKAAGLDGITAEHLQYSHPLLVCVLSKLFNGVVKLGHVPASFGQSYTDRAITKDWV